MTIDQAIDAAMQRPRKKS